MFASDGNRGFCNADTNNFQPRVGFAYQLNPKTVVRGGWAIYAVPALFDISGIYQPGFSQGTSIVPSLDTRPDDSRDAGQSVPGRRRRARRAPATGPNTFVGRTIGRFNDDLDYRQRPVDALVAQRAARAARASGSSRAPTSPAASYDLTTDFNAATRCRAQYLSTSTVRDHGDDQLPRPRTSPIRSAACCRARRSTARHDAAPAAAAAVPAVPEHRHAPLRRVEQLRLGAVPADEAVQRRLHGPTQPTRGRDFKERVTRLNDTDPDYEERFNDTHLPHRLVVSGIWELPFGRGRRWGSDSNAVVNGLIGNWSVSFICNWQSGRPNLTMGNVYYNGDITQLKTKYTDDPTQPVFDTSGFYFHDAAVQTNGVDDPAKQRADQRIQLASNIRTHPDALGRPARAGVHQLGHVVRQGLRVRPGARPVQHRALQRVQQRVLQHTRT